jgi:hypothetical protein
VAGKRVTTATVPAMDLGAERAALGGVLLGGVSVLRAIGLAESAFYLDRHRAIFRAMHQLAERGEAVDTITVQAELARMTELDLAGGPAALALLETEGSIAVNVPSYARIIADLAQRREYDALGKRLAEANGAGVPAMAAMVREAETRIRELAPRVVDEAPSELTALLAHRFPPRADIIGRGLLPRAGLLVNGGAPKLGKSLVLGNALLQRARGRTWLGFPTDPGVSLIVQSELRAQVVADRFRTMLKDDPDPVPKDRVHVKARRGVMLDEPDGLGQIAAWIEETGADLVGIDPLARHMAGDENSNKDMSKVVRAVDSLIERYGVAVWIVHHPSKPKDGDQRTGGMRLRGGSALFGAADSVVMMDRTDEGFTLSFELRHGATPEPMRVTRTEDLWLVDAGPDGELMALAALTVAAPLPYKTLVGAAKEDLKLPPSTAKRRIASALTARLLGKDLDGLYRPTSTYHSAVSQSHGVSSNA